MPHPLPESHPLPRSAGKKIGFLWAALAVFLTVGFEARGEENTVLLRYKFQPNQAVHFDYSQEMTMHVQKKEFKQKIESQTSTAKHLRVISVDSEGTALLEPVIDRVRMSSREDDGVPTSFDSDDGPEKCPAAFRPLLQSVGQPKLRIKFSALGHVVSVDGINDGKPVAEQLQKDPSLNFLIVLPESPVKVGDTWKDDFEVDVQIDKTLKQGIKLRREYRLAKIDGSNVEIELRMGAITPIRDPAVELQLSSRLLSGTIVFDREQGQIVSRHVKTDQQVINALGEGSLVRTIMVQKEQRVANPKLARRAAQ